MNDLRAIKIKMLEKSLGVANKEVNALKARITDLEKLHADAVDLAADYGEEAAEKQKRIEDLDGLVIAAHDELDRINGEFGNLCMCCFAKEYDALEGVVHRDTCIIKKIRLR